MIRLVFMLVGLISGVAVGTQARSYGDVGVGVLVFLMVIIAGLSWFAGQRDRAQSVAVAVAKATAIAAASAESQAAAIAQAAVHLHMAQEPATQWRTIPERASEGRAAVRVGRHGVAGIGADGPVPASDLLPQLTRTREERVV